MGHFKYDAIAMTTERSFLLVAGLVVLLKGYPLVVVAGVLAVSRFISFVLLLSFQYRMGLRVLRIPDLHTSLNLAKTSAEYVIQSVFLKIYDHIDVVMLTWMRPFTEVGWYSAGRRIFEGLWMIPNMITEATYPEINARHLVSKDLVFKLFDKALKYMLVIAVIVSVGTVIIGRTLVDLLWGESFANTSTVLMLLGVAIVPSYVRYFCGNTLIAINLQKRVIAMSIARSVLNVGLNLILIIFYGYIGATIATVATEYFSMAVYIQMMRKEGLMNRSQLPVLGKLGVAAAGLIGFNLLTSSLHPIIRFFMTIGVYLILLWLLKVFERDEILAFKRFVSARWKGFIKVGDP
jgi:O-antigen/teichoic acid export membrane protein